QAAHPGSILETSRVKDGRHVEHRRGEKRADRRDRDRGRPDAEERQRGNDALDRGSDRPQKRPAERHTGEKEESRRDLADDELSASRREQGQAAGERGRTGAGGDRVGTALRARGRRPGARRPSIGVEEDVSEVVHGAVIFHGKGPSWSTVATRQPSQRRENGAGSSVRTLAEGETTSTKTRSRGRSRDTSATPGASPSR